MRRQIASLALAALVIPALLTSTIAQERTGTDSGLPLPRFVSLKSGKVNMRVGPGRDYKVEWEYQRSGLPVEIIAEFDRWRRVRDAQGTEGWVYGALLSGRRTVVVAPWLAGSAGEGAGETIPFVALRSSAEGTSRVVARLEPGVTARATVCDGTWCRVEPHADRVPSGWMRQSDLWGAYPGEAFE